MRRRNGGEFVAPGELAERPVFQRWSGGVGLRRRRSVGGGREGTAGVVRQRGGHEGEGRDGQTTDMVITLTHAGSEEGGA